MTSAHHALTAQASDAAIDTACRLLRLPTMRVQAADTIARAEREGLSYAGFLAELLMAECEDRDPRRAERRIRAAHFPREKSMREFDYRVNPNVDPAVIHNLATCEWIAKGYPLCLIGDSGTGTSHLLIGLGTAAAMAGYRVRYTTAAAMVIELVEAADDKQLGKTIARYGRVDLLEIDELGSWGAVTERQYREQARRRLGCRDERCTGHQTSSRVQKTNMAASLFVPATITAAATLLVGIATACVAVYGARLANSYRRQLDLKTSERRIQAYAALWAMLRVASPSRPEPMSEAERNDLFEQVTDWYYTDGNGMLLTDKTRQLYLKAKENLRCSADELFPASLCAEAHRRDFGEHERWRSEISRRQLSLLRTQMKADLAIYGMVSAGSLHGSEHRLERDFLEACGINLDDEPWIHSC